MVPLVDKMVLVAVVNTVVNKEAVNKGAASMADTVVVADKTEEVVVDRIRSVDIVMAVVLKDKPLRQEQ